MLFLTHFETYTQIQNNIILNKASIIKNKICVDSMLKAQYVRLGMAAHTCNPSGLGGQGGRITWGQEFDDSLANMVKPHLY